MKKILLVLLLFFSSCTFHFSPEKDNSTDLSIQQKDTAKSIQLKDTAKNSIKLKKQYSQEKPDEVEKTFNPLPPPPPYDKNTEVVVLGYKKREKTSSKPTYSTSDFIDKTPKSETKPDNKTVNVDNGVGLAAFSIPDTMELGKCYIIKIRINRDTTAKVTITSQLSHSTTSVIKVTSTMEVKLIDPEPTPAFNIVKIGSNDVQLVDVDTYTEWTYNVCPIKRGPHSLNLIISIVRNDAKKDIVYNNSIVVKNNEVVVIKTFWEKYWQYLLSTFIFPLIIWLWKRKNKEED